MVQHPLIFAAPHKALRPVASERQNAGKLLRFSWSADLLLSPRLAAFDGHVPRQDVSPPNGVLVDYAEIVFKHI